MDLGGKKDAAFLRGNKHQMAVRDHFSRYTWMYFVTFKSDAAVAFEKFCAGRRVECIPSEVMVFKSDDGGKLSEEKFGKLCQQINTSNNSQLYTGSPAYNGVAERGLIMIESAALATRVQASELLRGCGVPEGPSLWPETMN